MLTEIFCDQFKDRGIVRPAIKLHPGLNIVVGGSDAKNSIGKTTFLLAVDFALGGNAYGKKSSSMIKNVGHHRVHFTHSFPDGEYWFCRDTVDLKHVWKCDENRNPTGGSMTIEGYNDWLAARYGLGELGSGFRDLQSPFFRIYGLKHDDVDRPLMTVSNTKESQDLLRLLRLYGKYQEVAEIEERKQNLDLDKKAFDGAKKRRLIRPAANRDEYKENEKRISAIEEQLNGFLDSCDNGTLDVDFEKQEYVATLKEELVTLKRSRSSLQRSLRAMDRDLKLVDFKKTKDFEKLKKFFPEIDIASIEQIEDFHSAIVKNLREQHRTESADMRARISELDAQIERIENSIAEAGEVSNLTRSSLEQYAELSSLVEQLRRANEIFDNDLQYKDQVKQVKVQREQIEMGYFRDIESSINKELVDLNRLASAGEVTAPKIEITDPDHYKFSVPNDDGTGSRNRGMFLLDVVLLNQTPLKFAIHDSPGIKQVEDGHTIGLLDVYNGSDKQIFIAIDKVEKYTQSGEVPKVISDNKVLELSEGHELFGRAWNRENEPDYTENDADDSNEDEEDE